MKKLLNLTFYRTKILPTLIILIALVFAGSVAYAFSPKPHLENLSKIKAPNAKVNQKQIKIIPSPTPENVLGSYTYNSLPSPTVTVRSNATVNTSPTITKQTVSQNSNLTNTNTNNSNTQQSSNSNTVSSIPTATLTPTPTTQPTASPTASPIQTINTVSFQIQTNDGTSNFSITLKDGANVCDVLQEAKDEGKINSVTFDDSYMSSLHSKYVYEINGYKNNWTFTVNGSSPLGCSLSNPKPNDSIIWKFG